MNSAFGLSPRVVAVPVFDPDHFKSQWYRHGSQFTLTIVNIVGMFIEGVTADPTIVTGRFTTLPGVSTSAAPYGGQSLFLKSVRLVR